MSVWRAWPSWRGAGALDYVWDHIHYPAEGYLRIRENARTLAGVEAVSHQTYALTEDGRTGEVTVGVVTAGLFDLVGVRPAMGRSFRPEETLPAAETGARLGAVARTRTADCGRTRQGAMASCRTGSTPRFGTVARLSTGAE